MTTNDEKIVAPRRDDTMLDMLKQWQWLEFKLAQSGGELDDEVEAFYSELQKNMARKIDSLDYIMNRMEAQAEHLKSVAEQYRKAAATMSANRERLRDMLKAAMEAQGIVELQGNSCRYRITNAAPALEIDTQNVPENYIEQIITRVPDKKRIKEELKSGKELPFARLREVKTLRSYVGVKI